MNGFLLRQHVPIPIEERHDAGILPEVYRHVLQTRHVVPVLRNARALRVADAVYMTRVQDEYDTEGESKKVDYRRFHLKAEHLPLMKSTAVIMHPLPRREELDVAIDNDPRAKYWRQERNGMWTRVALLTKIFGVDRKIVLPEL